jgi:hypothetical protein
MITPGLQTYISVSSTCVYFGPGLLLLYFEVFFGLSLQKKLSKNILCFILNLNTWIICMD